MIGEKLAKHKLHNRIKSASRERVKSPLPPEFGPEGSSEVKEKLHTSEPIGDGIKLPVG